MDKYIIIGREEISVTDKVYYEYKRFDWRERKEEERKLKCILEDGTRCNLPCTKCYKDRNKNTFSLEELLENEELVLTSDLNIEEETIKNLDFELLHKSLKKLDKSDYEIIYNLFFKDMTLSECGKQFGKSHVAIIKKRKKILEKLRLFLEEFNYEYEE
ncbi:MAG: hypothetical protein FWF57_03705 [Defluviitaleaceae bacterium]|nr:hypothetical protein [Defluviitaleaceae bacterium]